MYYNVGLHSITSKQGYRLYGSELLLRSKSFHTQFSAIFSSWLICQTFGQQLLTLERLFHWQSTSVTCQSCIGKRQRHTFYPTGNQQLASSHTLKWEVCHQVKQGHDTLSGTSKFQHLCCKTCFFNKYSSIFGIAIWDNGKNVNPNNMNLLSLFRKCFFVWWVL